MRNTMTIKVTRGKCKGEIIVLNANAAVPAKWSPFKVIDGDATPPVEVVAVEETTEAEEVVAVEETTETEENVDPDDVHESPETATV